MLVRHQFKCPFCGSDQYRQLDNEFTGEFQYKCCGCSIMFADVKKITALKSSDFFNDQLFLQIQDKFKEIGLEKREHSALFGENQTYLFGSGEVEVFLSPTFLKDPQNRYSFFQKKFAFKVYIILPIIEKYSDSHFCNRVIDPDNEIEFTCYRHDLLLSTESNIDQIVVEIKGAVAVGLEVMKKQSA